MKYCPLFIITFLVISINSFAIDRAPKALSEQSAISIITSGAGEGLYEKFGHAAIRVKDDVANFDEIYNYGIFDFNDPNFYVNFSKGFMKYKLVCYPFYYALKSARNDKRWVKEQILNLTLDEKNQIFSFLKNNVLPQNAAYFYDPFFDNCATKPRDILKNILADKLILSKKHFNNKSLRYLMNTKLHQNSWGSVGINFALGSKLDKIAKAEEYIYLPEFLFASIEKSTIKRNAVTENLVKESRNLLVFDSRTPQPDKWNPLIVFLALLIITISITYINIKKQKRSRWFDVTLFLITGVLGLLIVYLWFFTNHSTAPNNFNALWAFMPNLIIGFMLFKNTPPRWLTHYMLFLIALIVVIPIIWLSKLQVFNWTLTPLFLALLIRYVYLHKTLKR